MEEAILHDSEQFHQLYLQGVDGDLLERLGQAMAHTQRLANIGSLTTGVVHELTSPLSIIASACAFWRPSVAETSELPVARAPVGRRPV